MTKIIATSACLAIAACADVPEPFELDHARVMAVRIDPPALAPGERATIVALATDAAQGPRELDPREVAIDPAVPPALAAQLALARDDNGRWTITAPGAALGDLVIALDLEVETADGVLPAQKTLALGAHADNPAAPAIALDGPLVPDRDVALTPTPIDPALAYRWFSSVGDLVGYTRATATLAPRAHGRGALAVVVRDEAGGTAWTLREVEVAP